MLVLHLGAGVGGSGGDRFVNQWLDDALEVAAAGGCLLRAAWFRPQRLIWLLLGLGVLSFASGDLVFDFVYGGSPPTPSLADLLYLAFYPACSAALLLLVADQVSALNRSVFLDGLIAALTAAAVGAAVVFEIVWLHTYGRTLAVLVTLAYPVSDVVMFGLVVFAFALGGWRPGRVWATLGAGLITIAVADSVYLIRSTTGTYTEGTLLDALWPAGLLLLALAAWQRHRPQRAVDLQGRFLGATPICCGFLSLAVLVYSHLSSRSNVLAVALSAGAIATVFARTALSFNENARLLARAREHSLTDPLTGLANRRKLTIELRERLANPYPDPCLLAILDLNGFKSYNDRFGHPAGDALLARLGSALATAFDGRGNAYRLGGDEFCVLAPLARGDPETLLHAALQALSEQGEGFAVTAAAGGIVLPDEATEPAVALRIADERLYAHKSELRGADSCEVLVRALAERQPSLRAHLQAVSDLAVALGTRLGLTGQPLTQLRIAAELQDIGKLAIPDAILQGREPLSPTDLELVRRHPIIGQRILAGAPQLAGIGEIVRSTHERWDGTGYPDGLAGTTIPLASRIIALADSYTTATSESADSPALRPTVALEICNTSQFDPDIIHELRDLIQAQQLSDSGSA